MKLNDHNSAEANRSSEGEIGSLWPQRESSPGGMEPLRVPGGTRSWRQRRRTSSRALEPALLSGGVRVKTPRSSPAASVSHIPEGTTFSHYLRFVACHRPRSGKGRGGREFGTTFTTCRLKTAPLSSMSPDQARSHEVDRARRRKCGSRRCEGCVHTRQLIKPTSGLDVLSNRNAMHERGNMTSVMRSYNTLPSYSIFPRGIAVDTPNAMI